MSYLCSDDSGERVDERKGENGKRKTGRRKKRKLVEREGKKAKKETFLIALLPSVLDKKRLLSSSTTIPRMTG